MIEECRVRAYRVSFTNGDRVLVWPDEVRFNVTRGYKLTIRRGVAADIIDRAIIRIAEQRHAAGNLL